LGTVKPTGLGTILMTALPVDGTPKNRFTIRLHRIVNRLSTTIHGSLRPRGIGRFGPMRFSKTFCSARRAKPFRALEKDAHPLPGERIKN